MLSKERSDIKGRCEFDIPRGNSSKDGCSIEFEIIATKEQEGVKEVLKWFVVSYSSLFQAKPNVRSRGRSDLSCLE